MSHRTVWSSLLYSWMNNRNKLSLQPLAQIRMAFSLSFRLDKKMQIAAMCAEQTCKLRNLWLDIQPVGLGQSSSLVYISCSLLNSSHDVVFLSISRLEPRTPTCLRKNYLGIKRLSSFLMTNTELYPVSLCPNLRQKWASSFPSSLFTQLEPKVPNFTALSKLRPT